MSGRPVITQRDREAAQRCCEYALRNLSAAALRDVDFHALASSFANHAADVLSAERAANSDVDPAGAAAALLATIGR